MASGSEQNHQASRRPLLSLRQRILYQMSEIQLDYLQTEGEDLASAHFANENSAEAYATFFYFNRWGDPGYE